MGYLSPLCSHSLFKYPTDAIIATPLEGMNKFWKGGIQNLDKDGSL